MFKITIEFPTAETERQIRAAGAALDGARRDLAEQIAPAFRSVLIEDFEMRSAGKPGVDGTVWPPDSPATVKAKGNGQIGIKSGRLEDSLVVRPGSGIGEDLVAEYTAPHAQYFDQRRPLFPGDEFTELPAPWEAELSGMIEAWAEQRVQNVLS